VHECTATKLKQHLLRVRVRASSKPQLKNAHFTTQYMPDAGDFRCFATPNNAFATAMVMFVTARMCACILQLGCKKKTSFCKSFGAQTSPLPKTALK
jgi:hypothetical protein